MPMIAEGMVRQFTFGGGVASGAAGFYPPSLIEQINRLGNRADEWPDTAKAITMLGAWVAKTYGGRIYGKGQNLKRQAIAHYAELFEEWDSSTRQQVKREPRMNLRMHGLMDSQKIYLHLFG